ncbi:MAG: hypothetical protein AAFV29_13175, partial [Myxococcota bacterium]
SLRQPRRTADVRFAPHIRYYAVEGRIGMLRQRPSMQPKDEYTAKDSRPYSKAGSPIYIFIKNDSR